MPESGGEFCHARPGFTPTGPYSSVRVASCGDENARQDGQYCPLTSGGMHVTGDLLRSNFADSAHRPKQTCVWYEPPSQVNAARPGGVPGQCLTTCHCARATRDGSGDTG